MSRLRLLVLGPPRLERGGRPVELNLRRALVYLAVGNRPHGREALAALLWPDGDEPEARGRLRRTLHRLMEALGDDVVVADGDTLRLSPALDLWLDGRAFEHHAAAGLATTQAQPPDADRLEHLTRAASLYADDFLAGFALPDSPAWDEWQFLERERLRQVCARVLEWLVAAHRARGEWAVAIGHARRWLALDPLHEPARRALMQLYAFAGQQAAALRQYQECARLLEAELGVAPEKETTALYEAIKTRRLTAPVAVPPVPVPAPVTSATAVPADRPPSVPLPETHYARSGDVSIAYQVVGDGPIDIVFVMGWVTNLDYFWQEPGFARFLGRLASCSRLILFDKRGTGLSDRAVGLPSLEQRMDDVRAVMDAVGSERAALIGVSEGGSMCSLFAATYPERTSGLVLIGCFPRRVWAHDYPWGPTPEERQRESELLGRGWGTAGWAALDLADRAPSAAADERFARWWATYLRMSASPGAAVASRQMNNEIDVRHILATIRVPTLLIHRTGDRSVPVQASRYMAERIPGARYLELPGGDHLPFVGNQDEILDPVQRFLSAVPAGPELERVLVTLLLVEPAEAAERAATPGDQRRHRALNDFQTAARQALTGFRGRELRLAGRRLLATFDGPARAIRCACAIVKAAGSLDLQVRAGLHTGECELLRQQVRGVAFHIAERVTKHAGRGEVLVSGTVKDLVAGSGLQFHDLGSHSLEGISGDWRLFRVASESSPGGEGLSSSARTPAEQPLAHPSDAAAAYRV